MLNATGKRKILWEKLNEVYTQKSLSLHEFTLSQSCKEKLVFQSCKTTLNQPHSTFIFTL